MKTNANPPKQKKKVKKRKFYGLGTPRSAVTGKYYVNPYPNPRAADGETSGYWQHRSQVFGKPILNPNPEKVDLDGDGIVEALQQSEHANPIASESGLVSFAGRKPKRKITFDKTEVGADGKITLDLVANDINQLVRDLYDIGVDGITTFGNNASVKIDASKIPALEQLPSLAFGRTPKRESSIEDENQRGNQNKSQTEVGDSAGQNTRETNEEGVVSLSAPKEASQDKKGADLSVTRVKGHIRAVEDALELIATRVKGQPRAESDLFTVRQTGASASGEISDDGAGGISMKEQLTDIQQRVYSRNTTAPSSTKSRDETMTEQILTISSGEFNIPLKQWLPSNFRLTVRQGIEDSTRRSKKKRRETNAMTREILNKILWLKLHRRQKQGYLCPTYHCKT